MELKDVKLTKQMAKVLAIAEQECKQAGSPCLMPEHLLLGCSVWIMALPQLRRQNKKAVSTLMF